jgi:hypothetical protein
MNKTISLQEKLWKREEGKVKTHIFTGWHFPRKQPWLGVS